MKPEIEISTYTDVLDKAKVLGCAIPTRFAILPRDFAEAKSKDELVHETLTIDIRKILRKAGIEETRLETEGERYPTILERSGEFIAPMVFISQILAQNPEVMSVILGVISNYIYDLTKNFKPRNDITFSAIYEKTPKKEYLKIDYKGSDNAFEHVKSAIEEIKRNA